MSTRRSITATSALVTAVALTLTGCGGGGEQQAAATEASVSASPAVTPDSRYGDVEELKDAAVESGYSCPDWDKSNVVDLAASSGACSENDIFSVFATDAALTEQVETLKAFFEGFEDISDPFLVGPNWIVNGPGSPDLREALGGTLVEP